MAWQYLLDSQGAPQFDDDGDPYIVDPESGEVAIYSQSEGLIYSPDGEEEREIEDVLSPEDKVEAILEYIEGDPQLQEGMQRLIDEQAPEQTEEAAAEAAPASIEEAVDALAADLKAERENSG